MKNKQKWVQVAIDTQTIGEGLRQAKIAVEAEADWIEVGTSLVTFEGMAAIDALVAIKQDYQKILVDYKTLDGVAQYFLETGKRGGALATVMAQAPDFSVRRAVEAGAQAKVEVMGDLYCWPQQTYAERAAQLEALGVNYLLVHLSIDEFRDPAGRKEPLAGLAEVAERVNIPVGAVVFSKAEALKALDLGAQFVVVGTPIMEAANALAQMSDFIKAVKDY